MIDDDDADAVWDAVAHTLVDRHQAGEALHHRVGNRSVGIGAGLAESADRNVDDARVVRPDLIVAEAEFRRDARPAGLDDDVGIRRQAAGDGFAFRRFQVERQVLLAEIGDDRQRRMVADGPADAAHPIAVRRFDLDHFRAVLGEHHGAVRGRVALTDLEDLKPFVGMFVIHARQNKALRPACNPPHRHPFSDFGNPSSSQSQGCAERVQIWRLGASWALWVMVPTRMP